MIKVKFLADSLYRIVALLSGPRGFRVAVFDYSNHDLISDSLCDA